MILSYKNQMRGAYAHEHIAKPRTQTNPRREQEVPKYKEKMPE